LRFPNREEAKLLYWGGRIAFINTHKNIYELKPVKQQMKNFFINEYGVFMMDSQTEYRYNKQAMGWYLSHNTKIPDKIAETINKLYDKKKYISCKNLLEKIYPEIIRGKKFNNIHDVLYEIVKETNHFAIDLNTEKYLPNMEAYSPMAIKKLYLQARRAKEAVADLFPKPPTKTVITIAVAMIIAIIVLAAMQNLPKWIRDIQAEWSKTTNPPAGQFVLELSNHMHQFILGIPNLPIS
jgi:hypothetical protein